MDPSPVHSQLYQRNRHYRCRHPSNHKFGHRLHQKEPNLNQVDQNSGCRIIPRHLSTRHYHHPNHNCPLNHRHRNLNARLNHWEKYLRYCPSHRHQYPCRAHHKCNLHPSREVCSSQRPMHRHRRILDDHCSHPSQNQQPCHAGRN